MYILVLCTRVTRYIVLFADHLLINSSFYTIYVFVTGSLGLRIQGKTMTERYIGVLSGNERVKEGRVDVLSLLL